MREGEIGVYALLFYIILKLKDLFRGGNKWLIKLKEGLKLIQKK